MLIDDALEELAQPNNVRFSRLLTICAQFFGEPRINGSHHIFKTPWPGDPRINLQKVKGGKAKEYQVKQVVQALNKLQEQQLDGENDD